MSWSQYEIQTLRDGLDYYQVEKAIANARYWEHQRSRGWKSYTKSDTFNSTITERVVQDIHHVREMLSPQTEHKRVFSVGRITIYTSDEPFKDQLIEYGNTHSWVVVRQARVMYPENTIALINPHHKFRTYLRSRDLDEKQIETLSNWAHAQGQELRISPALQRFLDRKPVHRFARYPTTWTADHYFFDHDDPSYVTMLHLVLPTAIRKTVSIVAK